jgi:hypothetical protein
MWATLLSTRKRPGEALAQLAADAADLADLLDGLGGLAVVAGDDEHRSCLKGISSIRSRGQAFTHAPQPVHLS